MDLSMLIHLMLFYAPMLLDKLVLGFFFFWLTASIMVAHKTKNLDFLILIFVINVDHFVVMHVVQSMWIFLGHTKQLVMCTKWITVPNKTFLDGRTEHKQWNMYNADQKKLCSLFFTRYRSCKILERAHAVLITLI